jgi:hemerythrin-like domain-containing protein
MRDAIEHLLEEHRAIMAWVGDLRRAADDLRRSGDAALPGALPVLNDVGRMMATTLEHHARKEDEALFPEIEKVFGAEGGPTPVMRAEHRDIHAGAELFRRTLRELNEVEHPAIEAGGARLRALSSGGAGAAELCRVAEEIVALIETHFAREEDILFPMAREILSREALVEAARRIEAMTAERTGG